MFMQILELIRWAALAFIVFFDVLGLTALLLGAVHVGMNMRRRRHGQPALSIDEFLARAGQHLDARVVALNRWLDRNRRW